MLHQIVCAYCGATVFKERERFQYCNRVCSNHAKKGVSYPTIRKNSLLRNTYKDLLLIDWRKRPSIYKLSGGLLTGEENRDLSETVLEAVRKSGFFKYQGYVS